MSTFRLEIITPEKKYPAYDVRGVDVPAERGRLTVLVRHEPFVCWLKAGPIKVNTGDGSLHVWPGGPGVMTVTKEGVTLLLQAIDMSAETAPA